MGVTKERWSEFNKDFVKHVPWNKSGEDFEVDGGLSEASEELRSDWNRCSEVDDDQPEC